MFFARKSISSDCSILQARFYLCRRQRKTVGVSHVMPPLSPNPRLESIQPPGSGFVSVHVTTGGAPLGRDKSPHASQPATEPPPASIKQPLGKWGIPVVAALTVSVIAAVVTLGVLGAKGKLGGKDSKPQTYFQSANRERNYTVLPAFFSELHSWLLPEELAALNASTDADVIVIGAGMAGLAAAKALHQQSLHVILLEARDRIGGRVASTPYAGGWAELGAAYIYGSESGIDLPADQGNPLTTAANILGVDRVMVDPGSRAVYGTNGHRQGLSASAQLQAWLAGYTALISQADAHASLADVEANLAATVGLQGGSLQLLDTALAAGWAVRYSAPLEQLSALYFDNSSSFAGVDDLVTGGYSRLASLLVAGLPDVRLSTPVAAIAHNNSLATVTLASGQALTAQYVIATMPLGVLKSGLVGMEPPLPLETEAALAALGVGLVNKVHLYFNQVFWDASAEVIVPPPRAGQDACAWPLLLNMAAYTGEPALVAHACGSFAASLEALPDEDVVASVMALLQSMYGSSAQAPLSYMVSRWGSDPYSMGSDSFYAVGSTPVDRATLAEPVSGSLLFAGEAASVRYPASVHGAYISGIDAAQRVMDSIVLPSDCVPGDSPYTCAAGSGTGTHGWCSTDACWVGVPDPEASQESDAGSVAPAPAPAPAPAGSSRRRQQ